MNINYRLTFITDEGEKFYMNIPFANEELTKEEIGDSMDKIILAGIVTSTKGLLKTKDKAELIKTEIKELV